MKMNDPEVTKLIPLGVNYCSSEKGIVVKISIQDQHDYLKWNQDFIQKAEGTDSPANKQHLCF